MSGDFRRSFYAAVIDSNRHSLGCYETVQVNLTNSHASHVQKLKANITDSVIIGTQVQCSKLDILFYKYVLNQYITPPTSVRILERFVTPSWSGRMSMDVNSRITSSLNRAWSTERIIGHWETTLW